jgi:hypothetical protein
MKCSVIVHLKHDLPAGTRRGIQIPAAKTKSRVLYWFAILTKLNHNHCADVCLFASFANKATCLF